jgi:hypothetical protein
MTTIYLFDPETGEHKGSMEAKRDSFWAELLPPPNHKSRTLEAPPAAQEGHVVCRKNGEWEQVEDHRGETVYSTLDGAERKAKELGPLVDATTAKPANPYDKWDGVKWSEDAELKAEHGKQEARATARAEAQQRISMAEPNEITVADLAVALGLR